MTTTNAHPTLSVSGSGKSRIGGLDLARGVAIVGMFWAHLVVFNENHGITGFWLGIRMVVRRFFRFLPACRSRWCCCGATVVGAY